MTNVVWVRRGGIVSRLSEPFKRRRHLDVDLELQVLGLSTSGLEGNVKSEARSQV